MVCPGPRGPAADLSGACWGAQGGRTASQAGFAPINAKHRGVQEPKTRWADVSAGQCQRVGKQIPASKAGQYTGCFYFWKKGRCFNFIWSIKKRIRTSQGMAMLIFAQLLCSTTHMLQSLCQVQDYLGTSGHFFLEPDLPVQEVFVSQVPRWMRWKSTFPNEKRSPAPCQSPACSSSQPSRRLPRSGSFWAVFLARWHLPMRNGGETCQSTSCKTLEQQQMGAVPGC